MNRVMNVRRRQRLANTTSHVDGDQVSVVALPSQLL